MYYIVLVLCSALQAPYLLRMALPKKEKREVRSVSVSFRVTSRVAQGLKLLAKDHNLSQADVVEFLVMDELEKYERKKR